MMNTHKSNSNNRRDLAMYGNACILSHSRYRSRQKSKFTNHCNHARQTWHACLLSHLSNNSRNTMIYYHRTSKSDRNDCVHNTHNYLTKERIIYHLQTISFNQYNNRNNYIFHLIYTKDIIKYNYSNLFPTNKPLIKHIGIPIPGLVYHPT